VWVGRTQICIFLFAPVFSSFFLSLPAPGVDFINILPMWSFYALRSQKPQKYSCQSFLIALLGSAHLKVFRKMLVKLNPDGPFIDRPACTILNFWEWRLLSCEVKHLKLKILKVVTHTLFIYYFTFKVITLVCLNQCVYFILFSKYITRHVAKNL